MSGRQRLARTAYVGEAAYTYDQKRFEDLHGIAFANMEMRQLRLALGRVPQGSRVLEVGCGTGRFSRALGEDGYSVVAVDPSPDMLEITREKCADLGNVEVQLAEGAKLSFADGSFDFTFAIRVLNQTESPEYALRVVDEMIRVTRPGGYVLVEFVNRRPFARASRSVRLSFGDVESRAAANGCDVLTRSGVLLFSQTVLNRVPTSLLRPWVALETALCSVFWRHASRGYVLLRRTEGEPSGRR